MEIVTSIKSSNEKWIGLGFIILILLTRTHHFGSDILLPDATLAVIFLVGIFTLRLHWLALVIIAALLTDFYALRTLNVSDYCMSLGYWGLIPTYLSVWGIGYFMTKRYQPIGVIHFFLGALIAISIAFVLSNIFWFAFSDQVSTLSFIEFVGEIKKYFLLYLGYSMFYLFVAWGFMFFLKQLTHNKKSVV